MRTQPLNKSLFLSWLRLIWMIGDAFAVSKDESDLTAF